MNLSDGGTIRAGFDARLDELRDISQNSRTYLVQIEQRERTRTGIASLKVRFNNVFGYYIEISKSNLHLAPADYERKQTLVNAERFTTPELKELEVKILEAEERSLAIEREIFEQLRLLASSHAARIKATAAAVAELDVAVALAEVAAENRYVRPRFSGIQAKCASSPAAIRSSKSSPRKTPSASSPTISTSIPRPNSSPSSPDPTWAASRPTCARPRCSRFSRRWDRSSPPNPR